jgi:hypothetical protein
MATSTSTLSATPANKAVTCKRCNRECRNRMSLIKHLQRKFPCKPPADREEVVDVKQYLDEVLQEKPYRSCRNDRLESLILSLEKEIINLKNEITSKVISPTISIPPPPQTIQPNLPNVDIPIDIIPEEISTPMPDSTSILESTTMPTTPKPESTSTPKPTTPKPLRHFGNENNSVLEDQYMIELYIYNDIVSCIKYLHFDPDHPENHNVKYNTKENVLKVYNKDGNWTKYSIHDLILSKIKLLEKVPQKLKGLIANHSEYSPEEFEESHEDLLALKYDAKTKTENEIYRKVEDFLEEDSDIEKIKAQNEQMKDMVEAKWVPPTKS